ncbi:hypothetical protein BDV59DRAFT_184687, partial [Aspergillus ambiguus]|uniref:uncharacterized protein n=1 Tax=Aspergillus ambiguus TaxID=176160 RepID=UPI003CCCAA51
MDQKDIQTPIIHFSSSDKNTLRPKTRWQRFLCFMSPVTTAAFITFMTWSIIPLQQPLIRRLVKIYIASAPLMLNHIFLTTDFPWNERRTAWYVLGLLGGIGQIVACILGFFIEAANQLP